ncbi:MAG: MBL fold metallo-hydrolase [Pseudomonadota bacterium]
MMLLRQTANRSFPSALFICHTLVLGALLLGAGCAAVPAPEDAKAATPIAAQDRFADVTIKTTEIVPGIYMLEGAGGNIGLSTGSDGAFIIDDQFAPLSARILTAIGAVTDAPLSFLLNTHWHGDHAGGNENFANAGAMIVAHDNVRKRLKEGRPEGNRPIPPAPAAALPVVTFSDTISFYWNDHDIHIIHPETAHTDGDAIVFFKDANVVHMGDVFFNGGYPFIDLASGGDLNGYIAAHNKVLAIIDDSIKIIPGHGPLASRDDLIRTRDMLVMVRERIQASIDAGLDEEAVLAAAPLKDLSAVWGQGFIKDAFMTRTAYRSLTREQ